MVGESFLVETPSTDPDTIVGRNVVVPVAQLTGDKSKQHMRVTFKATDVKDKQVNTAFNGLDIIKEFIYRGVRKYTEKVEAVYTVKTKDNWQLQITTVAILNRNSKFKLKTKVSKIILDVLQREAEKVDIDHFVKSVIGGEYQKAIRKEGNKVYPLRFAEISKIEVQKAGLAG